MNSFIFQKIFQMKKLNFTFLLSYLFVTTSIFCQNQKWEFGFTLKSNFITLDIDDEIYNSQSVLTGNADIGYLSRTPLTAKRTVDGKFGIEGGLGVKYNFSQSFSFISGLEGRLIRFTVSQEVAELVELVPFTTLGTISIPGNPWGAISGGSISRDSNGYPIFEVDDPFNFQDVNQNLFYINFPLNIAYTSNSQKWIIFAGLNYSYLLHANIEDSIAYPNDAISYFNRSLFGVNLGISFQMSKHFSISLNCTGQASNIYSSSKTVLIPNSNYTDYIKIDEKNPASKNFNLFSLGLTYNF